MTLFAVPKGVTVTDFCCITDLEFDITKPDRTKVETDITESVITESDITRKWKLI